jgi:hypothetical protein
MSVSAAGQGQGNAVGQRGERVGVRHVATTSAGAAAIL